MALCTLIDERIKNAILLPTDMMEEIGLRTLGGLAKMLAKKFDAEISRIQADGDEILDSLHLAEDDLKKKFEKVVTIPIQTCLGNTIRKGGTLWKGDTL